MASWRRAGTLAILGACTVLAAGCAVDEQVALPNPTQQAPAPAPGFTGIPTPVLLANTTTPSAVTPTPSITR